LDLFERKIIEVLSSGEPKDFHNLLSKVDNHNTLRQHLDQLIARGLVERRKVPKEGPGRPSYRYSLNGDTRRSIAALLRADLGLVMLSFAVLQRLCRHEKGGYCKEIRGGCDSQKCPKIVI
jgi:predicted ArsR family transcriptional regulator